MLAAARAFQINIVLTDRDETHLITVGNGVLIHEAGIMDATAGATVQLTRPQLLITLLAGVPAAGLIASGAIAITGDATLYEALTGLIEPVVQNFAIVTP